MPKMTDQEFDSLFREAANRISPQPPAEDWGDMQKRLEKAERDARARNISLYSMVILLLLYSLLVPDNLKLSNSLASMIPGFGLSATRGQQPMVEQSPRSEATISATPSSGLLEGDAGPVRGVDASPLKKEAIASSSVVALGNTAALQAASGSNQRKDFSPSAKQAKSGMSEGDERASSVLKPSQVSAAADSHTVEASIGGGTDAASGAVLPLNQASADEFNASREVSVGKAGVVPSTQRRTMTSPVLLGTEESISIANTPTNHIGRGTEEAAMRGDIVAPSTEPLLGQVSSKPGPTEVLMPGIVRNVSQERRHPWFVKLVVSPDFSTIDYGEADKPGINLGLIGEYSLSPRFTVSTGAIWSKKIYSQANPEKSYGQGPNYVQADMLDADCRILDVPLNVTYYMLPGKKTNLFVSLGGSSYVMLDEKYCYTIYGNYRDYEYTEDYSNKNVEWFSMLNLSFGVQHQIGRRWFVQGEPFLKAPVKGVGEGKVNLASAGVFISLKCLINP